MSDIIDIKGRKLNKIRFKPSLDSKEYFEIDIYNDNLKSVYDRTNGLSINERMSILLTRRNNGDTIGNGTDLLYKDKVKPINIYGDRDNNIIGFVFWLLELDNICIKSLELIDSNEDKIKLTDLCDIENLIYNGKILKYDKTTYNNCVLDFRKDVLIINRSDRH